MNATKIRVVLLGYAMSAATHAAEIPPSVTAQIQPDIIESIGTLSPAEIERQLPGLHPANYYAYAGRLWGSGKRDEAVFWFYAGQLRYRFRLMADPGLDPSGDPALFASLQSMIGEPINLYVGSDPKNWMQQIDSVLAWDAKTTNGFTSKTEHKKAFEEARAGLVKLRDYIGGHLDDIRSTREQQGVGEVGVTNGVYVEERKEKMPKDWPALLPQSSPEKIAGVYEASFEALLGPILFFEEQSKVFGASSFELSVAKPGALLVIAKKGQQELLRRTIAIRQESGSVVFDERRTLQQTGLSEGGANTTNYLRVNAAGELVIQRDSLTEGKYPNKPTPVRLVYTFWNRAKRLTPK